MRSTPSLRSFPKVVFETVNFQKLLNYWNSYEIHPFIGLFEVMYSDCIR